MAEVNATFVAERISFKQSQTVADAIRSKPLAKAKRILSDALEERRAIDGKKFYPRTAKAFLTLLNSAEANARQKNIDTEKLFVRIAKADKGYRYVRPKSLAKYRGRKAKVTNISVVLEAR
jgi:ribosomal protein L22